MKNIVLLFSLTILCSYCKSTKPVFPVSAEVPTRTVRALGSEINGVWGIQSLWGMDNSKVGNGYLKIDFDNRSFTGNAGCNDISGKFTINKDLFLIDKKIEIAKNECPAYIDKKFMSMLTRINRFEIHDNILELSQDNIVLMTFKKN